MTKRYLLDAAQVKPLATGMGALFTLLVAAQWFAAWVLSPCLQ